MRVLRCCDCRRLTVAGPGLVWARRVTGYGITCRRCRRG